MRVPRRAGVRRRHIAAAVHAALLLAVVPGAPHAAELAAAGGAALPVLTTTAEGDAASVRVAVGSDAVTGSVLPQDDPVNAQQPIRISTAQVGIAPDRVRLVLESEQPIQASVIHPTETGGWLGIDLPGVSADAVLTNAVRAIRRNPYLEAIGVQADANGTRLQLIAPMSLTAQIFKVEPGAGHGNRLIVDLFPEQPLPAAAPTAPPPAAESITAAPAPTLPTSSSQAAPEGLQETWLEVHLNGASEDTVLVLRDASGRVLMRAKDLERWRIPVGSAAQATLHNSENYYPLSSIAGLRYRVDPARAALLIEVPPDLLAEDRLSGAPAGPNRPTPPTPGAWINYDVFADREPRGGSQTSALLQTGFFNGWGSGSNTLLSRRVDGHVNTVRLDTAWTHDVPDKMASLRIGDSISGISSWGRSIRFGGVQWATNFATQPDFITLPTLTLGGVAVAPSTVDYYVNDVLRLRREVPPGPFTVQDLPVVTGQGEVRMVVRDLLGREQIVTQPFYAGSGLLAPGLHDYSYELGFERKNYGLESNDYGTLAAIGTQRAGLSDRLTGEVHAELTRRQQTVGVGGEWLVANAGVLSTAVAASHDAKGSGELLALGFQHQSSYLSYGFRTQFTTPGFTQLGYEWPERPPRQATSAYLSFGSGISGSFGLNYTREAFRDGQPDVDLVGASYSHALGRFGYMALSGLHFFGEHPSSLFTLSMTMPLGSRDSLSFNAQTQAGDRQGNIQYQRNLPNGSGIGYRLQKGLSTDDPDLAELSLQNDVGTYIFGTAREHGQQAYQASVRGGVAVLDGKPFPSRSIDGSFAVVQVPGFPNVRVYQDNQQVATTDSNGDALVPRLRPYQDNPIRIEQADLPLDAEIQGLHLDAVPYYHSGLLLKFPVRRSRGAVLTIKLRDGSFLPAGAGVTIDGDPTVFPVGMRGEVYLTGLQPLNRLRVMWHGQSCALTVRVPEGSDPLPQLDPVTCKEIAP